MNSIVFDNAYTDKMLRVAEILKTIAHPVRLNILNLLIAQETLNVSEIQNQLGCDCEQSMLSHHLNKMKDKAILSSQKNGKYIYYTIQDNNISPLLECIEKLEVQ